MKLLPPARAIRPYHVRWMAEALAIFLSVRLVAFLTWPAIEWQRDQGELILTWAAMLLALSMERPWRRARLQFLLGAADDLVGVTKALAIGAVVAGGLQLLIWGDTKAWLPSAGWLTAAVAAGTLTLLIVRFAWSATIGRTTWGSVRVAILGSGTVAGQLVDRLERVRGVVSLGAFDDDPVGGMKVLGGLADLAGICARERVETLLVAFSRSHPEHIALALREVRSSVAIAAVPRYFELKEPSEQLQHLDGLPVGAITGLPSGRAAALAKRTFDLVLGGALLLATLPLLTAAGVLIKLNSKGPVLFRQVRLGKGGCPFTIFKLRTMAAEGPIEGWRVSTKSLIAAPGSNESSPRIDRLGRILRRTAIDEIPQLINVIRGEMSLVGPRPFVPEECRYATSWAMHRFDVRPGMTGPWQIYGQHRLSVDELRRLDDLYVATWSLGGDLRILLSTPRRLMSGAGSAKAAVRRERKSRPPLSNRPAVETPALVETGHAS